MYRLEVLGGLTLHDGNGHSAATQRRRLILLAVLASAGNRGVTREKLIGLLWADNPTDSARHALEQFLSTLRRQLGDGLFLGTDPIRLNPAVLSSDLCDFLAACDSGDHAVAATLYRGPLLDGVSFTDAGEFERWADVERQHARARYLAAVEHLATEDAKGGRHLAAVEWWRKLVAADPLGARGAAGLIQSLAAIGDSAAAMQHARVYEGLMRDQLDLPPDPLVARLVEELQAGRIGRSPPRAPSPLPEPNLASGSEVVASPASPQSLGEPRNRRQRTWLGGVVVLLGVVAGLVVTRPAPPPAEATPIRIAILPYENLGLAEDTYFADGLAEEITYRLSGIPELSIRGRTSVLQYRGSSKTPAEIGKELGVEFVLGGTVQSERSGSRAARARITSSLQRSSDNSVVWTRRDEGDLRDPFTLQGNIAEEVLRQFNIALAEPERLRRRAAPTRNLAAFQEYLLGRSEWALRTGVGIEEGIRHFERAIALDSTYALAYTGLASAWVAYPWFWSRIDSTRNLVHSGAEAYHRADIAARHALALDSTLVEAQSVLVRLVFHAQGDYPGALPGALAMVQRDPDNPFVINALRHVLSAIGRPEAALVQSFKAVEVDPLSPLSNTLLGVDLQAVGRPEEAMAALRLAINRSPRFAQAYMILGTLLLQAGQREAGADSLRNYLELKGYPRSGDSIVAKALAGRGPAAAAIAVLDGFTRIEWEPDPRTAGLYALLGAKEQALEYLEKAKGRHLSELGIQRYQPFYATLREEPRFKALWTPRG